MWKYRCKAHLISLFLGFIVGVVLGVISFSQGLDIYETMYPADVIQYMSDNRWVVYVSSGLAIAGIVNIIRLMELASAKWNINPLIVVLLVFFVPDLFLYAGVLLVIPSLIASVVGLISLYREKGRYYQGRSSTDDELIRLYTLAHPLHPEMKAMGETCRKNAIKIRLIYVLGIIAATCVIVLINNMTLLIIAFMAFIFSFNIILRYRSTNELPIVSLLMQNCDPEACASAIIYYSMGKRKSKIQMHIPLAQCLIYMDDPELAQDVLTRFPRKDRQSSIQYWTVMSYVYYLLKDESSLERCKDELTKLNSSLGLSSVFIPSEEMGAVQNKIHLMNGDLNGCKKYYLGALQRARFPFQQVDACYYIGLISFVEQDYPVADMYFKKVVAIGNKMNFVAKAKSYLEKLNQMDIDVSQEL